MAGRTRRQVSPLNRERVLRTALKLADRGGLAELSMRNLADELSVEAMSLYHHFANKDEILDGLVDIVFSEIIDPTDERNWHAAVRRRAISVREALRRHPWAIGLMESRAVPGLENLKRHDSMLGLLRGAGFSMEMAGHAYALLDSYVYGFALQEKSLPFQSHDELTTVGEGIMQQFPMEQYPQLAAFMVDHAMQPGYSFGNEFLFGLDLILDGLDRMRPRSRRGAGNQPSRGSE